MKTTVSGLEISSTSTCLSGVLREGQSGITSTRESRLPCIEALRCCWSIASNFSTDTFLTGISNLLVSSIDWRLLLVWDQNYNGKVVINITSFHIQLYCVSLLLVTLR